MSLKLKRIGSKVTLDILINSNSFKVLGLYSYRLTNPAKT